MTLCRTRHRVQDRKRYRVVSPGPASPRTPTTTVAIRRLEKLGLVKRSRDPSDLRAVLVEVTPRGLVQHREALEARRAFLGGLLAGLSAEDKATLTAALGSLDRLADQSPT